MTKKRKNIGERFRKPKDISTTVLVVGFSLLFIVIMIVWIELRTHLKNPPGILDLLVNAISFYIVGLAGFVAVIRKEFPPTNIIRGKLAVLLGLVWAISGWVMSGKAIYLILVEIFIP